MNAAPSPFDLACAATPVVLFLMFVALTVLRAYFARRAEAEAFEAALADLGEGAVRFDLSDARSWPDVELALEYLEGVAQRHGHAWLVAEVRDLVRNRSALDVRVLASRVGSSPVAWLGSGRGGRLVAWVDGELRREALPADLTPPPALARRLETLATDARP